MSEMMEPTPPGPMASWSFGAWSAPTRTLAEEFLLEGVSLDFDADTISVHLIAGEGSYEPPGPWEVHFTGVSQFDLARILGGQDPRYIATTIAEPPRYSLFSDETTIHLTASSASLLKRRLPQSEPEATLEWRAPRGDRVMFSGLSDALHESTYPWEYVVEAAHFSTNEGTLALRLRRDSPDESAQNSERQWMIVRDVESLMIVSRTGDAIRNYTEDMPSDGRTIYLRLAKAVIAVTGAIGNPT